MNFLHLIIFLQILIINNFDYVNGTGGKIRELIKKKITDLLLPHGGTRKKLEPKPLEKWAKKVATMTFDELIAEFQSLNPNEISHMMEETRVKLSAVGKYINANYIMDAAGKKNIICTQGPMKETIASFWQMIVEQKIEAIMMVTDPIIFGESNIDEKCAIYWPLSSGEMEGVSFNGYKIKKYDRHYYYYRHERIANDYEHRVLEITSPQNEKHIVEHFYLRKWPYHGVPIYVNFNVNSAFWLWNVLKNHNNIAVHGAADTGRTGTFVAIGMGRHLLEIGELLDIPELVKKLGKEWAVENVDQYLYIYILFLEYAKNETQKSKIDLSHDEFSKIVSLIIKIKRKLYPGA